MTITRIDGMGTMDMLITGRKRQSALAFGLGTGFLVSQQNAELTVRSLQERVTVAQTTEDNLRRELDSAQTRWHYVPTT